ncbi:MAG: hypothetical protein IKU58_07295 [Clostridia bacterium]|nr:hypothetical protein [Clostridia bacterium]
MHYACSLTFLAAGVFLLSSRRRDWLLLFWAAAVLHEAGHLAALRLLGGRAEKLCFRLSGAEIRYSGSGISYGGEVLLALAGPGANLLWAVLLAAVSRRYPGELLFRFIGCHLVLAMFNLLPALPLDGGRVLQNVLEARFPLEGEGYTRCISCAVGGVLCLLGLYVLLKNRNPTLFSAGSVILLRSARKKTLHLPKKLLKYKFKL